MSHYFLLSIQDEINTMQQMNNSSLKNSSSDSGSDLSTATRPRAIDNSGLVVTSHVKVLIVDISK